MGSTPSTFGDLLEEGLVDAYSVEAGKSIFGWPRIPFLGTVSDRRFKMAQPAKAQAIRDWLKPTVKDHVVSFRAFVNYLRAYSQFHGE